MSKRQRRERAFDRRSIVMRLERARDDRLLVYLRRRTAGAPDVSGFVIAIGRRWAAVAALDDRVMLDGWSLLRISEILAVTIQPDSECFEIRALKARSQWPVPAFELHLDDFEAAASSLVAVGGVIGVSLRTAPTGYRVGSVKSVDRARLRMRCISAEGRWEDESRTFHAKDVLRLNTLGAYDDAYRLAAGPESESSQAVTATESTEWSIAIPPSWRSGAGEGPSLVAVLQRARRENALVAVRRRVPSADRVEGYVVGVGRSWLALAKLNSGFELDGWAFLRLRDLKEIGPPAGAMAPRVPEEILRARSQWPPQAPAIDLDGFVGIVTSAAAASPLTAVFTEYDRPDSCWIGSVRSVGDQTLSLLEIDTKAEWDRRPRLFDAEDVTRLEFGGGYEEALNLVSGPAPIALDGPRP